MEQNIPEFHQKRLKRLASLRLKNVLKRKNPYLFKAKNVLIAGELVSHFLQAHLSFQEETFFGNFLHDLAIYVCEKSYSGQNSGIDGVDLEFERDGTKYLVSVKSGPHWGNKSQKEKMRRDFLTVRRTLATNRSKKPVVFVNRCCYGREASEDKGDYIKLCGERFWELISGIPDLYLGLVEPLGYEAQTRNDEFIAEYAQVLNRFTVQFAADFCKSSGEIDWDALVKFNSQAIRT